MTSHCWMIAVVAVLYCHTSAVSGNGFFFQRQFPSQPHLLHRHECGFSRYPSLCVETLVQSSSFKQVQQKEDVVSVLVNKTIVETTKLSESPYFSIETNRSYQKGYSEEKIQGHGREKVISASCKDLLTMSISRLDQSREALGRSPLESKPDIQTWLSAAITFQQTCKDLAQTHGLPGQVVDQIDYVSRLCSNTLALVNRIMHDGRRVQESAQDSVGSQSQSQRFPNWVSRKDRKLLQGTAVKANAVVAKDGSGHYKTVSEAIAAASGAQFVIYVKAGVYKEKIRTNKNGITLIGDGKYSTIIEGDDSVGGDGTSLSGSATFAIYGDRFLARDIGFQNNAGPGGDQAIALTVSSDRAVLFRCSIAGYQDTLYALALRQFYRECDIYGTVDFIFGNAAAVFQSCDLILRRPGGKSYNAILASGRSDPGQNTGFSIQKCGIKAGPDFSGSVPSYLGRPWKEYSRAVVMESTIDKVIASKGWIEWPGYGSSVLKTLYFAEYGNEGSGSGTSGRVKWSGFHILASNEAARFTVGSFISGTSWLPSTGVTFVSGLH